MLDILWEPKEDTIGYMSKVIAETKATKISILLVANTIFDPLFCSRSGQSHLKVEGMRKCHAS